MEPDLTVQTFPTLQPVPREARAAVRMALLAFLEELSETAYCAGHMMDLEQDIWNRMQDYEYAGTCQGYGMENSAEIAERMPTLWALARLADWHGEDIDD